MAANDLPDDTAATENANRGLIAQLNPPMIITDEGRTVWNNNDYNFLQEQRPSTVPASPWRHSQLTNIHGLFKVTENVFQIRGYDASNITFIESSTGVIILDPGHTAESSKASFQLYTQNRGRREVRAVLYSHSHVDHYGGILGILPNITAECSAIPIIAPDNIMQEAIHENVLVASGTRTRAALQLGLLLPKSPLGHVGNGNSIDVGRGAASAIPPTTPTDTIKRTGEERAIDGVRMVFQIVSGTEAPSEFNIYFPSQRTLFVAETATNTMHNIVPPRGTFVRDARKWSESLDEAIHLFGHRADVVIAGHNWPTFGRESLLDYLRDHRDLYAYIQDQTIRLINQGLNGTEIAEILHLPPTLANKWHLQGFYGSLIHNIKAVYQRYLSWFDGNPANLWKHPPTQEGKRYIAAFGGAENVITTANIFSAAGDLRFAATLLDHVVKAQPTNTHARTSLAGVYEKLGYAMQNHIWRNFYLTTAQNLRAPPSTSIDATLQLPRNQSLLPSMTISQWFTILATQLDGPAASKVDKHGNAPAFTIKLVVKGEHAIHVLELRNGTLHERREEVTGYGEREEEYGCADVDLTVWLRDKENVYRIFGEGDLSGARRCFEGDSAVLERLVGWLGVAVAAE